jgi:ATP-binding cassette subfamily B protein
LRLSGGEKQRVAIARAVLKNTPILVLDEATSALDSNTEIAVQDVLMARGKTCVVVAHRLSTIKDANMILVLREGLIVERGSHDELISLGKEYFDLWTRQQTLADS